MYRNARAEMVKAGMSLEKLAKEMNTHASIWSEKLNGKRPISLKEAKQFKKVVNSNLPLEELFKEFEEVV